MYQIIATPILILVYLLIAFLTFMFLKDFFVALKNSTEARVALFYFVIGLIIVLSYMSFVA